MIFRLYKLSFIVFLILLKILLDSLPDHTLEFVTIFLELPNSCREEICSHLTVVHFISENRFSDVNFLNFHVSCFFGVQLQWNLLFVFFKVLEKFWRNRQSITTAKFLDLASISERSSHDNCLISIFLEIVVNFGD